MSTFCITGAIAGWSVIVVLLNMSAILTDSEVLTQEEAAYVSMGILLGYTVILMVLDVLVARRMLSTMFTPYCLAVCFYAMVIYKRYAEDRDTIFAVAAVSLTISGALLVIKFVIASCRECVCVWDDDASSIGSRKYEPQKDIDYGAVAYENNSGNTTPTGSIRGQEEMAGSDEMWTY